MEKQKLIVNDIVSISQNKREMNISVMEYVIEYMEENEKKRRARETISLYMPVARQLKNEGLIKELNELSMRYVMESKRSIS